MAESHDDPLRDSERSSPADHRAGPGSVSFELSTLCDPDRLAAVRQYQHLPIPRTALQNIAHLCAKLLEAEFCLITILDYPDQAILASVGWDQVAVPSLDSFCMYALSRGKPLVVLDALCDDRFSNHPIVTAGANIRFYGGAPLVTSDGFAIGTLCVLDKTPRESANKSDIENLECLAALVMDQLKLSHAYQTQKEEQDRFEQIAATSPDAIVCTDSTGAITFWNAAAASMFGYTETDAIGAALDMIVPERFRAGHEHGMARVIAGGKPHLVGSTVELDALRRDQTEFPVELSLSMWGNGSSTNFGAIIRDITDRRADQEHLKRSARVDPLTNLGNRTRFNETIDEALSDAPWAAVLLLDLDGFKEVNDRHGHQVGDGVLKMVAERLQTECSPSTVCCRLGGDEFALLVLNLDRHESIISLANHLINELSKPYVHQGQLAELGASIGMAFHPEHGSDVETLLTAADLAMYGAKTAARGSARVFSEELRQGAEAQRDMRKALKGALANGEFELFYQPEVDLVERRVVGCEALIRWFRPGYGMIPPDNFLPTLAQTPLVMEVGDWILQTAFDQAAAFRGTFSSDFRMAINLFDAQLRDPHLVDKIMELLRLNDLPPDAIELEVTENIVLTPSGQASDTISKLRSAGISIAFDDYGTGFASLQLLKTVPVSKLKIDKSFTGDICTSAADAALVGSIIFLAEKFQLEVVAEGVETEAQLSALIAKGCRLGQGYLFSKPVRAAEFVAGNISFLN